ALREHTEIGYRILEQSDSEYLQMAAEVSLHHHEHYDGTGYPKGIVGRDIPLPARIVAVAEAFDNLTGGRDHRTTLAIPMAIRQIKRYAGAMYDPRVVDALRWHYLPSQLEARVPSGGTDDVF
ncbi:MAG: HD-GYP domain-containing protein, partial [Candidatus Sericytochromatia bacterium]